MLKECHFNNQRKLLSKFCILLISFGFAVLLEFGALLMNNNSIAKIMTEKLSICRIIIIWLWFSAWLAVLMKILLCRRHRIEIEIESKNRLCALLKYSFTILILLLSSYLYNDINTLIIGILELAAIGIFANSIVGRFKKGGLFGNIIIFIFNAEQVVRYFGGTFITLVMLQNLVSVQDLAGNSEKYILGTVFCIAFSAIPLKKCHIEKEQKILSLILATELVCFVILGALQNSVLVGIYSLYSQYVDLKELAKEVSREDNVTSEFFKEDIIDMQTKPDVLSEHPNIILIFTEGLSQEIVEDERMVMPNVFRMEESSLNFKNYYNHTFATYRGLQGQLYSGYSLNDLDNNSLVSIQKILSNIGYYTTFINSEPTNLLFTSYLEDLGFGTLLTSEDRTGESNSVSDEAAYDLLYNTAIDYEENHNEPFFLCMYTFGTHTSLDSADNQFEGGDSNVLNRFHNLDYWFGQFMEKFNNSALAEDTIIIFTADHSVYADADYYYAYPDSTRIAYGMDEIPFFIYHAGIMPQQIDVEGRNSLDMVPTILDYLDISAPNYFLGETLFFSKSNGNNYDTVYYDGGEIWSSNLGEIQELSDTNKQEFLERLQKYFAAKTQTALY